jgi:hypothetical protein
LTQRLFFVYLGGFKNLIQGIEEEWSASCLTTIVPSGINTKYASMKPTVNFLRKGIILSLLLFITSLLVAQNRSFFAANDTIDVTPFVPTVFDILANDTIPAGDTISWVSGGGSEFVICTNVLNKTFSFTARDLPYNGKDSSMYTIMLKSGVHTQGKIIFHVHNQGFGFLDINNVNALFMARGSHFFDENARFEVPKGSGKTSIFSNTMWMGGKDAQGNLHFSGERYRQGPSTGMPGSKPDFYLGPVMDSANYSIYQDAAWNHIWNLKKSEVEYHRVHYQDAGYTPIPDILTWPGNGNTALGQAARLAPFFDRNGNGIYEPMDGDFPEIRGDQELFFIFNDDRGSHQESEGGKLRVEIHGMAYAFDMPEDSALKNTVFLNYQFFNRSQNTYDSTFLGVFTDIDLGYAMDDYIGCDAQRGMYFGYNGTPIDGTGQTYAYGAHPPVQAVDFMAGPYMDADGIDNPKYDDNHHRLCDYSVNGVGFGDEIVDNERYGMTRFVVTKNSGVPYYMTDPLYAQDYYHLMEGIWLDGTPIIYGGNGHPSAGGYGPACRFMFPGESDTLNWGTGCTPPSGQVNWTESTAGNAPGDRRGIGITGPFTFKPGDKQELDLAFVWSRDYNAKTPLSSLDKLGTMVDKVNSYFVSNTLPNGQPFYLGSRNQGDPENQQLNIYPNPARNLIHVDLTSQNGSGATTLELLTTRGETLKSAVVDDHRQKIAMDVSSIPAGLYLLRVMTNETILTKKVIIIR